MRIKNLSVAAITFICLSANAQPGALDPSFGQGGVVVTTQSLTSFENILPLANGQFLVTDHELSVRFYENGATESYTWSKFWRYNANGTLDLTYGTNGQRRFFSSDEYHQYFTSFAVLTDGRIVATEGAQVLGSPVFPLNRIWIFNADGTGGSILAELSVAGYFSVNLNHITADKNNRIVVTGYVRGLTASDRNKTYIARLLSDGNFDETFNNVGFRVLVENSSFNYSGELVATDAGNNIIIVEEGNYNALPGFYISKFLQNGPMETNFGNVKSTAAVRSLVTDGNSKIIYLDGGTIKRLNSNGTADVTFPSASISIRKLLVQPDNKVIAIGGGTSNGHSVFKVGRYLAAGTLDPAFGTNGTVITDLNFGSSGQDAIYRNRRLYVSGSVSPLFTFGTIIAYDATDLRMTCPTVQSSYSVDAGKCYATVNGINAVMSSLTLHANVQHTMVYNGTATTGEGGVAGRQFQKGTTKVTYSYTDITTQTCSFDVVVYDGDPPVAKCRNLTLQLDAAGNVALTAAQVNNGSTDGCGIKSIAINKTNFSCSDAGENAVTLIVTDNNDNQSNCIATVTIEDNVLPVAKCKNITLSLDENGTAPLSSAQIDNGSTDECGIKTLSVSKNSFDCSNKGSNMVTLTVTDNNDNVATCTAAVSVVDLLPPSISNISVSHTVLTPPNHSLRSVIVNYSLGDNCPGTTATLSVASNEPQTGINNGDQGPDWIITGSNSLQLRAERDPQGTGRIYTITITATDASGNVTTATRTVTVPKNNSQSRSGEPEVITLNTLPAYLEVTPRPNPSKANFTIQLNASNLNETIKLQVTDMYGRIVETRNVASTGVITIGDNYRPGTYIAYFMQGKEHRQIKLTKL